MIPVFLLGSAVYLVCCLKFDPLFSTDTSVQGLELTQVKLSHQKYMAEATKRIDLLEADIAAQRQKSTK